MGTNCLLVSLSITSFLLINQVMEYLDMKILLKSQSWKDRRKFWMMF